jgi:hypothetical protein
MVGVSSNLAMPMGRAQARGDFSLSCNNLKLHAVDFSKTAMLMADCKTNSPRDPTKSVHKGASINLNDIITNSNGALQWAAHGDFQQTCYQTRLKSLNDLTAPPLLPEGSRPASSPHFLDASCNQFYPNESKLNLDDHIANIDGNLKYVP